VHAAESKASKITGVPLHLLVLRHLLGFRAGVMCGSIQLSIRWIATRIS